MPALVPISIWHWVGFIVVILVFIALDLGVFRRSSHVVKPKEALWWSGLWFGAAMLFAGGLCIWRGKGESVEFVAGYFVEYSLSMDNVAVMAAIFASLGLAAQQQHRVLMLGILGALVMRGVMIAGGVALIRAFHWVLPALGVFLIITGIKWGFTRNAPGAGQPSPRLARLGRALKPLGLALLMIEGTDLLFAVDSIPAVFAVTQNPFIVFTSNIFAVLGLRSLYFAVAGALQGFRHLKAGLAAVLIFAGGKILAANWLAIPAAVSVAIVAGIIALSIGTSVLAARKGAAR